MTSIIFIIGFLISLAVCYALFAYTIHEMRINKKTRKTTSSKTPELVEQPIK